MKYGIIIFSLAFACFAHTPLPRMAPWEQAVRDHSHNFELPLKNPYVTSVWGSCTEPRDNKVFSPQFSFKVGLNNPYYTKGKIQSRFGLHHDAFSKRRDLVVIIPGAFNNVDDRQVRRLSSIIFNQGHNILAFPNPWGSNVVSGSPTYLPGDFESEAYAIHEALKSALKFGNKFNIKVRNIRVLGVSYGAFVSSILSYIDAKSRSPFLKDFTLISPPYHMGDSLSKIDDLMNETSSFYKINYLLSYPFAVLGLCRAKGSDEISDNELAIARYLSVYVGFHSSLVDTLKSYVKGAGLDFIPGLIYGVFSSQYRDWRKSLRFTTHLEENAPEVLSKLRSEQGNLNYWINKAQELDIRRVRILTSQDDFINHDGVWEENNNSIINLPYGGHFGFRSSEWFEKFLALSYSN